MSAFKHVVRRPQWWGRDVDHRARWMWLGALVVAWLLLPSLVLARIAVP